MIPAHLTVGRYLPAHTTIAQAGLAARPDQYQQGLSVSVRLLCERL